MTVDVFIITHDHADTVGLTLASLAIQTTKPSRVIVIDNASVDGSGDVAENNGQGLPLEVMRWRENRGFAVAANEALRRSAAPWVLSLNPDCRLSPDFIETLVTAAARCPGLGSCCGLLLRGVGPSLEPSPTVDSAGMIVTATGRHHDRGSGGEVTPDLECPAKVFGASGACVLYRRDALADVAYPNGEIFDERFFAYREDADLAWRLQRRGWSCLYWPAAQAFHRRGLRPEAHRRGTPAINRLSVRNRFLLRWSNADWRWHLACFPAWLVRDLLVVAACVTVETSSLPGLFEAFRLRRQQRNRGRANTAAARVSSWRLVHWFLPGGGSAEVPCR